MFTEGLAKKANCPAPHLDRGVRVVVGDVLRFVPEKIPDCLLSRPPEWPVEDFSEFTES